MIVVEYMSRYCSFFYELRLHQRLTCTVTAFDSWQCMYGVYQPQNTQSNVVGIAKYIRSAVERRNLLCLSLPRHCEPRTQIEILKRVKIKLSCYCYVHSGQIVNVEGCQSSCYRTYILTHTCTASTTASRFAGVAFDARSPPVSQ